MLFKKNKKTNVTINKLPTFNLSLNNIQEIFLDYTTFFGLFLMVVSVLLPLHTLPIATFEVEITTLCGLILLCLNFFISNVSIPKLAIMPLLLALIGIYHMCIYNQFSSVTLLNSLYLGYILCFFLSIAIAYHIKRLNYALFDNLSYSLIIIGAISSIIMLCQMFEIAEYINQVFREITFSQNTKNIVMSVPNSINFRPFGNVNQPNHMMTFMAWSVTAWIYLGLTKLHLIHQLPLSIKQKKIRIASYWLLGILLSVGLVLPASRSFYLHALVLISICLFCIKHRPRFGLYVLFILIFATVISLLTIDYAKYTYNLKFTTLFERNQNTELASNLRSLLHQHGWLMFKQSPIFGVSYGQYSWMQFLNIYKIPNAEMANSSHNIIIDMLAKTGLMGLLICVIPMLNWLIRMLKMSVQKLDSQNLNNNTHCSHAIFALGIVGSFTAHAMLEYPQHYLFFIIPLGLVLGYTAQNYIEWLKKSKLILLSIMSIIVTYAILISLDYVYGFNKPNGTKNINYGFILHPYMDFSNISQIKIEDMDDAFSVIHIALAEDALHLLPSWSIIKKYSIMLAKNNQGDKALSYIERAMHYFNITYIDKISNVQEIYILTQHPSLKLNAYVQKFAKQLTIKYPTINITSKNNANKNAK